MMKSKVRIVQFKKNYKLVITKDGVEEIVAEVYDQADALLLSYMIEKAFNGGLDEAEFKDYILKVAKETPFIKIPEE